MTHPLSWTEHSDFYGWNLTYVPAISSQVLMNLTEQRAEQRVAYMEVGLQHNTRQMKWPYCLGDELHWLHVFVFLS